MILLLTTGLLQIKNYLLHNRAKLILILVCIAIVAGQAFFMATTSHQYSYFPPSVMIDFFPFLVVVTSLFILLSFGQANILMISPSEANIFFVSPIREHKILLYIFIKSSYQIFILLIAFAQLNVSIIAPFFHFNTGQTIKLFLWESLLFTTYIMFSIFLAILKKKNRIVFYILEIMSIGLFVAIIALFLLSLKDNFQFLWNVTDTTATISYTTSAITNIYHNFNRFFSAKYWSYVPIVGLLINSSKIIYEVNNTNLLFIALTVLLNALFIMSPYYIKVSMGETAIEASQRYKNRIERKKGQTKSFKIENKAKNSSTIHLSGPWAIVSKQWIDYKRCSKFFLSGSLWFIIFIMGIYLIVFKLTQFGVLSDFSTTSEDTQMISTILSLIFVGILAFISLLLASDIPKNIINPIIYLIPARAYKKLLAISVIPVFENAIKALLLFVFQRVTGITAALAACISLLYFLCILTGSFVDLFTYSVFYQYKLWILQTIAGSFIKLFIIILISGIYTAICYLLYPQNFSFVSIPALLAVTIIDFALNFALVFLSENLINKRE